MMYNPWIELPKTIRLLNLHILSQASFWINYAKKNKVELDLDPSDCKVGGLIGILVIFCGSSNELSVDNGTWVESWLNTWLCQLGGVIEKIKSKVGGVRCSGWGQALILEKLNKAEFWIHNTYSKIGGVKRWSIKLQLGVESSKTSIRLQEGWSHWHAGYFLLAEQWAQCS